MKKLIFSLSCISLFCYGQQFDPQLSRVDEKPHVVNIFKKEMPFLETSRLLLRPISVNDAQDLFEVHSDPEVVKYMPIAENSVEQTKYWIEWRQKRRQEGDPVPWVMVHKQTGKVLGLCGFYRIDYPRAAGEVMITLNRKFWGKGFMQEAMKAVADYGFSSIGLNRIDCLFYPENKRITRLCEKVGLQFVGHIPECYYYKGRYWDRLYYTLLKKDWPRISSRV